MSNMSNKFYDKAAAVRKVAVKDYQKDELKKLNNDIKIISESLEKENKILIQENKSLIQENKSLIQDNESLIQDNESLIQDKEICNKQIEKLFKKIEAKEQNDKSRKEEADEIANALKISKKSRREVGSAAATPSSVSGSASTKSRRMGSSRRKLSGHPAGARPRRPRHPGPVRRRSGSQGRKRSQRLTPTPHSKSRWGSSPGPRKKLSFN